MRSRWRCTSSPRFDHYGTSGTSGGRGCASEQREQVDRRHWRYVYNRRCSAGLLLATLTTMLLIPRQKRQTRNKERWQRPDVAASLLNVALRLCCSAEHTISDPDSCTTTEAWTDATASSRIAACRYCAGGPKIGATVTGTVPAPAAGAPAPAAASRCHARSQQSGAACWDGEPSRASFARVSLSVSPSEDTVR